MKKLIFAFALLSSFTLSAQINDLDKEKKQAEFCIKIQPFSLLSKHVKVGIEYALDSKNAIEIQGGKSFNSRQGYNYDYAHVQFRYKRYLTYKNENLKGLYIAPGADSGIITKLWNENDYSYATIFSDLGFQYSIGIFNIEIFVGCGWNFDCKDCEFLFSANALNFEPLALRSGLRVGLQF